MRNCRKIAIPISTAVDSILGIAQAFGLVKLRHNIFKSSSSQKPNHEAVILGEGLLTPLGRLSVAIIRQEAMKQAKEQLHCSLLQNMLFQN